MQMPPATNHDSCAWDRVKECGSTYLEISNKSEDTILGKDHNIKKRAVYRIGSKIAIHKKGFLFGRGIMNPVTLHSTYLRSSNESRLKSSYMPLL